MMDEQETDQIISKLAERAGTAKAELYHHLAEAYQALAPYRQVRNELIHENAESIVQSVLEKRAEMSEPT